MSCLVSYFEIKFSQGFSIGLYKFGKIKKIKLKKFLNEVKMKSKMEESASVEIMRARERNRLSAKKRRIKDRLVELEKQSEYAQICQENERLKKKVEFLNRLRDLMNITIQSYSECNGGNATAGIDDSSLSHFIDLESTELYELSFEFVNKTLSNNQSTFGKEQHWYAQSDCSQPDHF